MGGLVQKWPEYKEFLTKIYKIIPSFRSEQNHLFNLHIFNDYFLSDLETIKQQLGDLSINIGLREITGLTPIHLALSTQAKLQNWDITEFNEIYEVLEQSLADSISRLNSVSISNKLKEMAEEIANNHLTEIKHKIFPIFPDDHHSYNVSIIGDFLTEFNIELLPKLMHKDWTLRELNQYISGQKAGQIIEEVFE